MLEKRQKPDYITQMPQNHKETQYLVFDIYRDKQSFQHKVNVDSHVILWLSPEIDLEKLKKVRERIDDKLPC